MLALIFYPLSFHSLICLTAFSRPFDSPPVTNQFVSASNFAVLNVFKSHHCLTFHTSSGFKTATATRSTIAWKVSRAVVPCTAVCCSAPDTAYLMASVPPCALSRDFFFTCCCVDCTTPPQQIVDRHCCEFFYWPQKCLIVLNLSLCLRGLFVFASDQCPFLRLLVA
jgi:hypothetical protein